MTLSFSCGPERDQLHDRYSGLEGELTRLSKSMVPDRRTDRLEARLIHDAAGRQLEGYTTLPAAKDSLDALLEGGFPEVDNRLRLLPDTAVGAATVGLINVSVANLRSEPGHGQELATQAPLGSPIELLDRAGGWYLVRTPDRYLAWLEPGAFVALQPAAAEAWLSADLHRFLPAFGFLTATPGGGGIVSDLVAGNLLRPTGRGAKGYREMALPDGTTGWAAGADLLPAAAWQSPAGLATDKLLRTAADLAGRPYLWGGTSPKGMDCSGFTKMAYYLNGYVIPRDASQQVHAGHEVELTEDFGTLRAADLLFFGRFREDGSEKITHVGVYLGDGRFLHAGADNGRIKENSLLPEAEDYAEHRRKSLLRARRLAPGTPGVLTVAEAFGEVLN